MSRLRLFVVFLPAMAILLAVAMFFFLMHTGPGARWLWERAGGLLPGELRAAAVTGDLQSGLRLEEVVYRDGGLSVAADRVSLRLDLDVLPPSLAVHTLEFGTLEIRPGPGGDEASVPVGEIFANLGLPIPVRFHRIRGERIVWRTPENETGWEIRPLALSADWFRDLELRGVDLGLAEPAMRWQGAIRFGFQTPFDLTARVSGTDAAGAAMGDGEPLAIDISLDGNLEALRVEAESKAPDLHLAGTVLELAGTPSWDLRISADRLPLAEGDGGAPGIGKLAVSSYGWFDDYGLEAELTLVEPPPPGFAEFHGRLVGAGDLAGLRIDRLEVVSEALALDGTGHLAWGNGFAARVAADVRRADLAPWLAAWGDAPPVTGRLDLAWEDGRIEFTGADLNAIGTFARLEGSGFFEPDDGTLEAALGWRELAWPPGAAAPDVLSPDGHARVTGRLEAWNLDADLEVEATGFPGGRLRLIGAGNAESMALEIPRASLLGGSLQGTLEARWKPELSWSLDARIENLSTEPLIPAWPGRIAGSASLSGRSAPLELEVDSIDLTGTLRGQAVAARGSFRYGDDRVVARGLRLRYGRSEVSLDGDLRSGAGLTFQAQIESLAGLLDGATGSLDGDGTISLVPANPYLTMNIDGRSLAWGGFSLDRLRVRASPGDDSALRVEAEGVTAGDTAVDALTLVTGSRRPFDEIEVGIVMAETRADLRLSGRVVDWAQPLTGGWRGSLQHVRWEGGAIGWVELEEPAAVSVDSRALTFAPACFRGSRQGRLCIEAGWQAGGERVVLASLEDGSPNLALKLASSDLTFTQLVSGTVAWRQSGTAKPRATVDLSIAAGEVRVEGEDEPIFSTGRGRFGFEIEDGRLFAGNLDIPLLGSGGIDTDFSAPDLTDGLASPVQGRLQLNLNDIRPVMDLIPLIAGSSGPVAADMRFSGTVADPRFTGHASLVRGRFSHFASGLLIENLQLAGAVYEFDRTELTGTFRAGDGQGSIRAVVNFDEILRPEFLVELDGQNLTLVNVPDLVVRADPDVRLVWREGTLDVSGRVKVPTARLSPRYLPTGGATESPDVVIVAGVDPHAAPELGATSDWDIRGELELELGNDVRLQLERAQARLNGTAVFDWDGEKIPSATGGFNLSGEILAYGQLLSVTDGRISFANRPADNPFLTIRAEREIFGNSQIRRAGVLVTGPLKRPVLEVYTDPMTTRERALALLVTGRDFNYEQGVGAVEVGMYVAPKLFISYGVGLFDNQNVISARYDLGKGFGLKATSGQRETGADISYTVER